MLPGKLGKIFNVFELVFVFSIKFKLQKLKLYEKASFSSVWYKLNLLVDTQWILILKICCYELKHKKLVLRKSFKIFGSRNKKAIKLEICANFIFQQFFLSKCFTKTAFSTENMAKLWIFHVLLKILLKNKISKFSQRLQKILQHTC